ncbi:MAG: sugar phosphate isomerase/epimerase family protein [Isosphaeraceae bacterium]
MTRRDALRTSLTLAAATSGLARNRTGIAQEDELPGRRYTMDLVCGNVGKFPPITEAVELALANRFESVAPVADQLAALSDRDREALGDRMRSNELVWGAASLDVDFRSDEARFREGLAKLPETARTLQRAGVSRMGTWLRPSDRELTYLANFRRHTERLRAIATILGDHGLRFGLEYVGPKTSWSAARYPFVHTMAEARELISAIDKPGVGLVLDSWHWYCAGESVRDLLGLENREIVACDLNDAPAGIPVDEQKDLVRELPAATGVIDVKGFLRALSKIGYDGPVRAEPFSAALRELPLDEAVRRTSAAIVKAFEQARVAVPKWRTIR